MNDAKTRPKKKVVLHKYKETERLDVTLYGATAVRELAKEMPFDDLMFWIGLGILLAHGATLKATHDKLTAWISEPLPKHSRWALKRTGQWFIDPDFPEDAWVSYWANG